MPLPHRDEAPALEDLVGQALRLSTDLGQGYVTLGDVPVIGVPFSVLVASTGRCLGSIRSGCQQKVRDQQPEPRIMRPRLPVDKTAFRHPADVSLRPNSRLVTIRLDQQSFFFYANGCHCSSILVVGSWLDMPTTLETFSAIAREKVVGQNEVATTCA